MKTYGYIMRVSTDEQDFKLQQDALNRYPVDFIFSDKMTGATMDRPGLKRAVKVMRPGDKLVVWRLDRLGRSMMSVLDAVQKMEGAGIELVSLNESIDTTTPMGRMFLTICAAFAKMERDLISERTKAGIAAHTARGGRMGQKHFVKDHPLRLARWRELWPIIEGNGMTGAQVVDEMRKADPDAPPINSVQSFYNWRRDGYRGFEPDTPLDEVEIDDEEGE
jgi:DNA invertase Pin-like site-specific DNA recombinase